MIPASHVTESQTVRTETKLYKYRNSEFEKGIKTIKKIVAEEYIDASLNPEFRLGSTVPLSEIRKILILTESRSGSSFLGQAINSYPGTFYTYEPLHHAQWKNNSAPRFLDDSQKKRVFTLLRNIFTCSLGPDDEAFLQHLHKKDPEIQFTSRNKRYWTSCVNTEKTEETESLCYNSTFFNEVSIIH